MPPPAPLGGPRVLPLLALLGTTSLSAAACADRTAPDQPSVLRRDSAGIEIVETLRPFWDDGGAWSLDPEPELVLGQIEGETAYLFGQVRGAVRLDDGSVVVVDNQAREVRWFDPSGAFVRSAGGPGGGPDEFSHSAYKLERCGPDRLYVHDPWGLRILAWDTAGTFRRGFPLVEPGNAARGPYKHTCRDDGGFVAIGWGDFSAVPSLPQGVEARLYRQDAPVWGLDSMAALETEFGSFLSSERIGHHHGSGPHPFGRAAKFAAGGGTVFIGTGEGLSVDIYRDGRQVGLWRASSAELALGEGFRDAYARADVPRPEERLRGFILEGVVKMPPELPGYTELEVSPDGHLWAKRFTPPWETSNRWGVFAPDGVFLGNLDLPDDLWVTEIGDDHVVGVVKGELDVERVHVYRLRR